mgnify:CR=1 FL=1
MGRVVKILGGEGGFFTQDYKLDANCVSGALGLRSTATDSAGEVARGLIRHGVASAHHARAEAGVASTRHQAACDIHQRSGNP